MRGNLVLIDAWSRKLNARVAVRVGASRNSATLGADGQTWEPALTRLPRKSVQLADTDLTGDLMVARGDLSLNARSLRLVEAPLQLSWLGSRIRVYVGDGPRLSDFTLDFDGRITGGTTNAETGVASLTYEVDRALFDVPLLTREFTGGGGAEGTVDVRGTLKPAGFGTPINLPVTLIDTVHNVACIDGYGNLQQVIGLYENLASFGASVGDFATYAALIAATVPEGRWATCVAQGLIRLGAPPAGTITCDAQFGAGRPGSMMLRWLRTHANVPEARLRVSDFDALTTSVEAVLGQPAAVSWWTNGSESVLDLLKRMAASCNAVPMLMSDGTLGVARAIGGAEYLTVDRKGGARQVTAWASSDPTVPWWKLKMAAAKSIYVNPPSEIDYEDDLTDMGDYDANETYRQGMIVRQPTDGRRYLYINPLPSKGHAPPDTTYWAFYEAAPDASVVTYADGTPVQDLQPAEAGATNSADPNSAFGSRTIGSVEAEIDALVMQVDHITGPNGDIALAIGGVQAQLDAANDAIEDIQTNGVSVNIRPNMLTSGSFERGFAGWTGTTNWTLSGPSPWGTFAINNSLQGSGTLETETFLVYVGKTYSVSADTLLTFAGAAAGSVAVDIVFYRADNTVAGSSTQHPRTVGHDFIADDSGRKAIASSAQAPTGSTYAKARLVWQDLPANSKLGMRQMQVEQGAPPISPYNTGAALYYVNSGVQSEITARAAADLALGQRIDTVTAAVGDNTATITSLSTTVATNASAAAQFQTTATAYVNSAPNLCVDVDRWAYYNGAGYGVDPGWGLGIGSALPTAGAATEVLIAQSPAMPSGAGIQLTATADMAVQGSSGTYVWFDLVAINASGSEFAYSPRAVANAPTSFSGTRPRSTFKVTWTTPAGTVKVAKRFCAGRAPNTSISSLNLRRPKVELGDTPTAYSTEQSTGELKAQATIQAGVLADAMQRLQAYLKLAVQAGTNIAEIDMVAVSEPGGGYSALVFKAGRFAFYGGDVLVHTLRADKIVANGITRQYSMNLGTALVGTASYQFQEGPAINVTLEYDSEVAVMAAGNNGYYNTGQPQFEACIVVDGVYYNNVAVGQGAAESSFALLQGFKLPAGTHRISLNWRGGGGTVPAQNIQLNNAGLVALRAYC